MKLYNWQVAPNPRRVRMFIAEKGINIETIEVGEPGQAKLSDAYLASNPHRIVPALELDDGTLIGEAPVICRYLESIYPETPLLGRDAREQAIIGMWDRKCELEGLQACAEILRNKVRAFDGRALPGYSVPIERIDALIGRGQIRLGAFFDKLDTQLGESPFVAGDSVSVADITAFCSVEMARSGKTEIPANCTNVTRWHNEMSARPSTKA
jgi:glutathione S-transferase